MIDDKWHQTRSLSSAPWAKRRGQLEVSQSLTLVLTVRCIMREEENEKNEVRMRSNFRISHCGSSAVCDDQSMTRCVSAHDIVYSLTTRITSTTNSLL